MIKPLLFVIIICVLSAAACAHQPRLVTGLQSAENNPIIVNDPELSRAYYGILKGSPAFYKMSSGKAFTLYVNILVPDTPESKDKRFSVEVTDSLVAQIILLKGNESQWQSFYEEYGGDFYMMGPEARKNVTAGTYMIKVFSNDNQGKYIIATGGEEAFPAGEIINAIILVPWIKYELFNNPVPLILELLVTAGIIIIIFLVVRRLRRRKK